MSDIFVVVIIQKIYFEFLLWTGTVVDYGNSILNKIEKVTAVREV